MNTMIMLAHAEILWIDDWWPLIPALPVFVTAAKAWMNRGIENTSDMLRYGESKYFDVDEAEARMFPFGKVGDVVFDTGHMELVVIEECEVKPHEHHGDEHEHVYLPSRVSAVRKTISRHETPIKMRYWIEFRKCNDARRLRKVEASWSLDTFREHYDKVRNAWDGGSTKSVTK